MKLNKPQVVVALAVLMTLCLGASAYGTSSIGMPFDYKFEPIEFPKQAGHITLVLEVATTDHCLFCDSITITIETEGGVTYNGSESYTVQGDGYAGTVDVIVLPNDTGTVNVRFFSKHPDYDNTFGDRVCYSFVSTGDTVEYFEWYPRPKPEPPPLTQEEREALSRTPEKLAQIHGIRVFLVDSIQQEIFKSIVGPLPENHRGRFYYLETTWGNMLNLKDSGINWRYIPPGEDPFPHKGPPPKADSAADSVPKKSAPSAPQGSLGSPASEDGISIVKPGNTRYLISISSLRYPT